MEKVIDILDRDKVLSDLTLIIKTLSNLKQGKIFALDGGWGYGKTYILEKLEKELESIVDEDTYDNKYYVFHYNCWQYDYYEEPAIAIISAMLEKTDSDIIAKMSKATQASWNKAIEIIKKAAKDFVKNKIGIDVVEIYSDIKENIEESNKESFKFDDLFAFKKTLDSTRKKIKEIAELKTVVFVVDELDRCMPTYAIKVLERLHHLFEGIDNVIVLLGIDSKQLDHSVKEIYGNVDIEKYLRKFISFRYTIGIGKIQNFIFEKFSYYFDHFEVDPGADSIALNILNMCKIDIRNLEKIIEKINLIHQMCFKEEQQGEILIFEVIWTLMKYKMIQAKLNNDIEIENLTSMYWIPEIDFKTYATLDRCISKKTIEYLVSLKNDAKSKNTITKSNFDSPTEKLFIINDDSNGKAWLYLDQILANKKTFYFEKKQIYLDAIEKCRMFCELGNSIF